ncbi:MAG: hypothetical protein KGL36_11815, partial [Gammaproteobacteria bacterium]|nr:hypothetical protein [Gammaproteobacteria bacterium]
MSVVEKAIQKLRAERRPVGAPGEATAPAGTDLSAPKPETAPTRAGGGSRVRPPGIVLDRDALRVAGLLPPDAEAGALAREYRKIKRPLVARAIGREVPRAPKGHL